MELQSASMLRVRTPYSDGIRHGQVFLCHWSAIHTSVFRHGDDFVVSGMSTQQMEFEEQCSKHLIVKHLATLGRCTALTDVTEVRILNRILRRAKPPQGSGRERIEYEADPRHAELIIHQLGLSCSSRSVSTPSEKPKPGVDLSSLLNSADHTLYQSTMMRMCYLALDRLDLQFTSKELARWMQAPTVGNLEALKRVARYLIEHGRLVQEFVRQVEEPSHVAVFTDSDHAGCLETRESTSSSKWFHGAHILRSTNTTQGVIVPNSVISKNIKNDKAALEVRVDASAGRGIAVRRGARRIRHTATPTLRVQKLTQDGIVKITKLPEISNPADLGTKHLDGGSNSTSIGQMSLLHS